MRVYPGRLVSWAALALGASIAAASPLAAQDSGSVNDYRLPDPTRTARPTIQGPVDPDNPVAAPSNAAPDAGPSAAPTPRASTRPSANPSPRVVLPATPEASRAPRPAAIGPAVQPSPRPSRGATAPTRELPADAAPVPAPDTPATTPPAAVPAPASPEAAAPQSTAPSSDRTPWLIGGALLLAALAGAGVYAARRRRSQEQLAQEPDHVARDEPEALPQPAPPVLGTKRPPDRQAVATPAPSPRPEPALSDSDALPLTVAFAPQAVRLSLVFATLQYELALSNAGAEATPPLAVRADLASAHASMGTREQLAPAPELLEAKHEVPSLAPGETAQLKGEVRVALQNIQPLLKGNGRFLVPLVRLYLLAADGRAVRRVFTVGPVSPDGSGLASIRLDAGPRNLRELDAREIEAARGLVLDPAGAHR